MNLGGLLAGLGNESSNNLIENNKTILIVAVIALIIFGFGYGRDMLGGSGFEESVNYREAAGYGPFNPEKPKNKKSKHKRHKRHHRDDYEDDYDEEAPNDRDMYGNSGMTGPPPNIGSAPDMNGPFGGTGLGGPGNMNIPPEMPYRP